MRRSYDERIIKAAQDKLFKIISRVVWKQDHTREDLKWYGGVVVKL